MTIRTLAKSSASSFAHLVGLAPRAKSTKAADETADDDEEMKAAADAEDGDGAGDDKEKKDEGGEASKKSKKSKKADTSSDDDEEDDEDEVSDDDDDENDEDDDERRDDMKKAEARGRRLERARGEEIFASEHAARNVALAAELAFKTSLSPKKAVSILERGGAAAEGGLKDRMQRRSIGPGAGAQEGGDSIAKSWLRAAEPFMPKK